MPFPTDHLIDIPPIHKKDKQNKDILSKTSQDKPKKKTKLDKNNEDQNKEISKEQNEIKSKELEKVFNLDFKTAPGELEIYNNKTPGNKHLPNLVHVDEYKYATFLAIDNGDIETFEDYAKRIGNLEYIDEEDNTLLIYAAMNDQPEIVEWLIKNKSALNAKNIYGATALHAAVINNNAKIVKALINAGASTKIVDQNGKTAKDYAISSDVQNLLDHNAVHKHNKIKSHNEKKTAPSSADSPKENELSSSIPKTNEVDMMMQGSQQKESQHTEKKKAAKKVKKTRQEKAESLH